MMLTNQRTVILDYMSRIQGHPTVEDIYDHVSRKLPRISKKTIYANLKVLASHGMVREVKISGVRRYESTAPPHHHLICTECKAIIDIELPELTKQAMKAGRRIKDFNLMESHVHYYGTCDKCGEKKRRKAHAKGR
jgi:Fur family peroxide stress response transcriptional regulator